jgi:peptide/nickel transport system ATP-binding protein
MALLEVQDLNVRFHTPDGVVRAVNGLSFKIEPNETVAIVGESGSGKTVTSLSILRLLASPPARISGEIRFNGANLLTLSTKEIRALRGGDISMVFQEPMTSLNPVLTVGWQIEESLRLHQKLDRAQARSRAIALLKIVGIPSPERRVSDYPHQFSGGMRQRAMIAMALACSPKLLIADEPTTALDVTIQAQVLDLMRQLGKQFGSAIMLITHDLGVVAQMADRVIVMYAGRAVEAAGVRDLFKNPQHPYTRGLLRSMPRLGSSLTHDEREKLNEISGQVPSLRREIVGCAFAPRCDRASDICRTQSPASVEHAPLHFAACHHPIGAATLERTL